ncbi:MAG: NHL repeat-containing protein, partial [Blastocatellia bacterium]
GYVGYRILRSNNLNEAAKPGATPEQNASPDAGAEKYGHVHLSGAAAEAEKDAQRAAWRIEVAPYLALGSGRPGNAASDFDKPAGLAFSPQGLLFSVDAGNRRIQIWDVKTGSRLSEFGNDVFGDAIAGIAIALDNQILVTDQARGLAYAFASRAPIAGKPLGPDNYQFKGVRFGDQGFVEIGGVAVDSKGRVYVADALRNEVLRFNPDGAPDKTWNFEKTRADGDTYLHGCDGIAIDEAGGDLFVASRNDAVVEVFDLETGAYKNRTVGASKDDSGKRVFFGSVRGMTVTQRRLLAVDENAGHIQVFDLKLPDAFNTNLNDYAAPQSNRERRRAGYQGFFGRAPLSDFEDRTDTELQRKVKSGEIIPGQANPPGHFCSPGAIASHTDRASGETYIAIADQCNYRIVVYRWSDITKALGISETPTSDTLAATKPTPENKSAPVAASKAPGQIKKDIAPIRVGVTRVNRADNATNAGNVSPPNKAPSVSSVPPSNKAPSAGSVVSPNKATGASNVISPNKATSGAKGAATGVSGASPGRNNRTTNNYSDPIISGKKAKKEAKKAKKAAKKEKKLKY